MGMRINVVGTAGSRRSTFAQSIAKKFNAPYIQLDEFFWKPNWKESCDEEFFSKVEEVVSTDRWILDGNYTRTIPIKWKRVQMVVYLDLPFHIVTPETSDWYYFEPSGYEKSLIGREWVWDIQDCWSLITDWYKQKRNIAIKFRNEVWLETKAFINFLTNFIYY